MMGIEVKLFRFSLPDINNVLYCYSLTSNEKVLRRTFGYQDPGDIPADDYNRLAREGNIERITSIEQVPLGDPNGPILYIGGQRDWIPYCSDYLESEFDLTISQFLDPEVIKKFE